MVISRRSLTGRLVAGVAAGLLEAPLGRRMACATLTSGATVYASSYGYNATDSTALLQAALDDPTADTVVIDNVGVWNTGPLFVNRDGIQVVLAPGTQVAAIAALFPHDGTSGECLLTLDCRNDVKITGHGAALTMPTSAFTSGEWRHSVKVLSSSNILIEGLDIIGSGGDGIYLGASTSPGAATYNSDIAIADVDCVGHRRNGLSVISVDGLDVSGSTFRNSKGAQPQCGIDLEVNNSAQRLTRVTIHDCRTSGNWHRGAMVVYTRLNSTSVPLDITFERVLFDESGGDPGMTVYGPESSDPGGNVIVRDSVVRKDPYTSGLAVLHKRADGALVTYQRIAIWTADTTDRYYDPISFTGGTSSPMTYGGADLDDVTVFTNCYDPYFSATAITAGSNLSDVTGHVTVVGLGAASTTDISELVEGVPPVSSFSATKLLAPTPVDVTVTTTTPTVGAGGQVRLDVDLSVAVPYALGVVLSCAGTAIERRDFDGWSHSVTIPAGGTTAGVVLPVRSEAAPGTLDISIEPSPAYGVGTAGSVAIAIV